jgi:hypothetical protein
MVRFPTLVLGATLGLAALGLSATASAGVRFGIDVGLPVVAAPVVAAPVVAAGPAVVAYHPGPYYGPRVYAGAPYYRHYFGPAYGYPHGPVGGWHAGYALRDGRGWRR